MGVVSPLGKSPTDVWQSVVEGRSGVGPITRFDATGFETRIAAEVRDFDPRDYLEAKEARRADRYIQFAVAATRLALADADLEITTERARRVGVLVGTAFGGFETAERELRTLNERGPSRVSPFFIPMFLADMGSGYVSIVTGARGPDFATLSACASAAHAIGEATAILKRGEADAMLAGGSEAAVTPGSVAGFNALSALSTRNDEAATASRPFDLTRDGFVIGEGAAMLVLETLDHARARGATILGEVAGYAATADANHIVQPAPDGAGAAEAMRLAIGTAGIEPTDVDYVNAHGTSTPLNDKIETLAMKSVWGAGAVPPVSSTKAISGHLLGAAGALEGVISLLAIRHQALPPTWHLETPDPECDLDYVANEPRGASVEHVLSNSLGFGGHNVSLIFSRYQDDK
jgi:3-oxoacyl-[acyl-carrier-protein] synthase II